MVIRKNEINNSNKYKSPIRTHASLVALFLFSFSLTPKQTLPVTRIQKNKKCVLVISSVFLLSVFSYHLILSFLSPFISFLVCTDQSFCVSVISFETKKKYKKNQIFFSSFVFPINIHNLSFGVCHC